MTNTYALKCPSCGAPIQVEESTETFACLHCGCSVQVERGGGIISLQMLDALSGVKRGTDKTAAELAITRLQRELSSLITESTARVRHAREAKQRLEATRTSKKFVEDYYQRPFRSFFGKDKELVNHESWLAEYAEHFKGTWTDKGAVAKFADIEAEAQKAYEALETLLEEARARVESHEAKLAEATAIASS